MRWEGSPPKPGGTPDPATGSVGGLLGQTGRLGLATERSAREERGRKSPLRHPPRWALPAIEANPQAGGTAHPNTGTRPAGGGPPMAGHVCQSVSVSCRSSARSCRTKTRREPQFGRDDTGLGNPNSTPRGSATGAEVARGRSLEAYVFKNWVSEIVQMVAWRSGVKWRAPWKAK